MSLFGLFFVGINIFARAAVGIDNWKRDDEARAKAKRTGDTTYFDHRGTMRLLGTNEPVFNGRLPNGERILKRIDGSVAINLDADRRRQELNEANIKIHEEGEADDVYLIGNMRDIFPDSYPAPNYRENKKYYKGDVYGVTALYKHKGEIYIRLSRYNIQYELKKYKPKYLYCNIKTRKWTFLNQEIDVEYIDEFIKYVEERDKMNDMINGIFIRSSESVDNYV